MFDNFRIKKISKSKRDRMLPRQSWQLFEPWEFLLASLVSHHLPSAEGGASAAAGQFPNLRAPPRARSRQGSSPRLLRRSRVPAACPGHHGHRREAVQLGQQLNRSDSSSHICKTKNSAVNPPLVVCPSPCPQNSRVRSSLPGYCRNLAAHASEAPQQFPEGSPWVYLVRPRVKSVSLSAGSTRGRINVPLFWVFLHRENGWSLFSLILLICSYGGIPADGRRGFLTLTNNKLKMMSFQVF